MIQSKSFLAAQITLLLASLPIHNTWAARGGASYIKSVPYLMFFTENTPTGPVKDVLGAMRGQNVLSLGKGPSKTYLRRPTVIIADENVHFILREGKGNQLRVARGDNMGGKLSFAKVHASEIFTGPIKEFSLFNFIGPGMRDNIWALHQNLNKLFDQRDWMAPNEESLRTVLSYASTSKAKGPSMIYLGEHTPKKLAEIMINSLGVNSFPKKELALKGGLADSLDEEMVAITDGERRGLIEYTSNAVPSLRLARYGKGTRSPGLETLNQQTGGKEFAFVIEEFKRDLRRALLVKGHRIGEWVDKLESVFHN